MNILAGFYLSVYHIIWDPTIIAGSEQFPQKKIKSMDICGAYEVSNFLLAWGPNFAFGRQISARIWEWQKTFAL